MQIWSVGPKVDDPTVTRMQELAREIQDTMFPPFRPRWHRAYRAWKDTWAQHFREHPEFLVDRTFTRSQRRQLRRRGVAV